MEDKFGLSFEGSITSAPAHSCSCPTSDCVSNRIFFGEKEWVDRQVFNSLWKHASRFVLLIQEVLRTDPHLLTADEKIFMGLLKGGFVRISFLEHENRYIDAINLLKRLLLNLTSHRRRGYWTLRLSIDLDHIGRLNERLTIAEDGLLDPWVRAGSRISLQRRVLCLRKPPRHCRTSSSLESVRRKITEVHVQGRPLNCKRGTKSRFYGEDGEQCGVEQLALRYYAGEGGGCKGFHSESGIWLTIFGLLMWDIMFVDLHVLRTMVQVLHGCTRFLFNKSQ